MPSTAALNALGLNICELRQIIQVDREASTKLQVRISKVRQDIKNGRRLHVPEKTVEKMESLNKDMTKELVQHIEKIEEQKVLTTTDRELLQALNAQLAICDRAGMQLAELRDLEQELHRKQRKDSAYSEPLPLGGTPRRPSKASTLYTPADISSSYTPAMSNPLPPPPPYTPSHNINQPMFTPPSSYSPRSSSFSLDHVDNQAPCRKSAERRHSLFTPPLGHAASSSIKPPSPPVHLGSVPLGAHYPTPPSPMSSRSIPPPSPPVNTPPRAEPMRRNSSKTARKVGGGAGAGEYQYYSYADYDDSEDEDVIAEWSKSDWPLLYRILDIDPSTDPDVLLLLAKRQLERLSLRHNPNRFPDDPDAPTRWIAINKAYDVLTHPERKKYYDMYHREPEEVEGINLNELKMS